MIDASFKDRRGERTLFMRRVLLAALLVLLCLALVAARLFKLQVVEHDHFSTLSEDNRIKVQPLPPSRGLIYDANGVLLADNLPSYALEITPENVKDLDATIDALAEIVTITDGDRERFTRLLAQAPTL
jgi:penicillin-binding protein 2